MAPSKTPGVNTVKWYPPGLSDDPTPTDLALHIRLLYNATNDHDQAITTLKQQQSPTTTTTSGATTTIIESGGGTPGPPGPTILLQTNSVNNAVQTLLNLIAGANITIVDGGMSGVTISATGSGPTLETNSVANSSQSILNLIQGTNVTITSGGGGAVTISASTSTVSAYVPRAKSISYTAVANDVISCNTAGGGITITLPAAASNSGVAILVKKVSTDANTLGIARTGSDLIDGATSQFITLPYASCLFVSDGTTNWGIF